MTSSGNRQLDEMCDVCAQKLYNDTMLKELKIRWAELPDDMRDSYRRMVMSVFQTLFMLDPNEVTEFFLDGRAPHGEAS